MLASSKGYELLYWKGLSDHITENNTIVLYKVIRGNGDEQLDRFE